jgi:pimeloyl-ACP methyl ester carboxylesterase
VAWKSCFEVLAQEIGDHFTHYELLSMEQIQSCIKPESRTRRLAKGALAIMRGAESDILSRETAARMLKVQRGVRLVEVPGVGHAPSLVEPAALKALTDFLTAKA